MARRCAAKVWSQLDQQRKKGALRLNEAGLVLLAGLRLHFHLLRYSCGFALANASSHIARR
jgi:hypothetical protein